MEARTRAEPAHDAVRHGKTLPNRATVRQGPAPASLLEASESQRTQDSARVLPMSPLLARQILGLQATASNLAVQRLLQPALPATSKRNAVATLQRKVAVKEAKPGGGPVGRARDI